MKSDKVCRTCEFLAGDPSNPFCRNLSSKVDRVDCSKPTTVCCFWSANLDGSACGKCVYWIGHSNFKPPLDSRRLGTCHKLAENVLPIAEDWWCGEFVPGVV
jgi:hypothetical protein